MNGQNFVTVRGFGNAVSSVVDSVNFPAFFRGCFDNRADNGVKAGTVAAAGENTNSFFTHYIYNSIFFRFLLHIISFCCILIQILRNNFQQKIFFIIVFFITKGFCFMYNQNNMSKLQHQLCELKLEERRVCSDIKHLVSRNKTIDFFQAKQLNSQRCGLKSKIKSVEARIMPNIIA